ncbi:DtxR family iron (metal) dependent repressor, partial [Candidatus Magnetomorum sp. HK-1]
ICCRPFRAKKSNVRLFGNAPPKHLYAKKEGIMKKKLTLSETLEDYLETILELENKNKVARVKDIADKLEIQRGSVTGVLKLLEKKGLINYQPYSYITLTDSGLKIAKKITARHNVLKDFLVRIVQLESNNAENVACRMEHIIDEISMNKFIQFIKFIDTCPRAGEEWINSFIKFCSSEKHVWEKCNQCIEQCKANHNNISP